MKRPGHPSQRMLMQWLENEDERLDRHLATCDYCARRLEALVDDEGDSSVQQALLRVLRIPTDLPERLQADLDARLNNQRDMVLVAEFFGLPYRTAQAITSNTSTASRTSGTSNTSTNQGDD